jgi:YidC/Oxa1 family membrane protein insertase
LTDATISSIAEQATTAIPLSDAATSTDLINAVVSQPPALKIGDLASMGFCKMTPPGLLERLFEFAHVTQGLPWWLTIVGATVAARLVIFPLTVKQYR